MRSITMYQTDDGQTFRDPMEAKAHEDLVAKCQSINKILKPRPANFNDGYIRQDCYLIEQFAQAILHATYEYTGDDRYRATSNQISPRESGAARLASECPDSLSRLWVRWACIDQHGREWSQPADVTDLGKRRKEFEVMA